MVWYGRHVDCRYATERAIVQLEKTSQHERLGTELDAQIMECRATPDLFERFDGVAPVSNLSECSKHGHDHAHWAEWQDYQQDARRQCVLHSAYCSAMLSGRRKLENRYVAKFRQRHADEMENYSSVLISAEVKLSETILMLNGAKRWRDSLAPILSIGLSQHCFTLP